MKIFKTTLGLAAMSLLVAVLFVVNSCDESETPPATINNHVSFTPCQQSELRSSSESSDGVEVKFTDEGIEIVYSDFEVTCDFTTVNVTHTLVNGVLNITQQATPNRADCVCYTDVSYTIEGISQDEVNVIFINDVQVYCYNDNGSTNPLIGAWREIYPCRDCSLLTFSDNDTIYHLFPDDNSIVKLTYHVISEDSIQIERLQERETNQYTRKTKNKIVFYDDGSILIEKFYVTDATIFPPMFHNIKLLKLGEEDRESIEEQDRKRIEEVKEYVNALKANQYEEKGFPAFTYKHIDELLKYRNEKDILTKFPRNPVSSFLLQECELGVYVLWTIESIRAVAINSPSLVGRFPSLNSILRSPHSGEFVSVSYNPEAYQIISDAYYTWWTSNKDKSLIEIMEINPLMNTEYKWH
jgi:hypothetical protein